MSLGRQGFDTGLPEATFAQAVPNFFLSHLQNHQLQREQAENYSFFKWKNIFG
jgi:hypothetical protein